MVIRFRLMTDLRDIFRTSRVIGRDRLQPFRTMTSQTLTHSRLRFEQLDGILSAAIHSRKA